MNRTDLATEEDTAYGIDHWARLFKAKTWEEIKMLAQDNEYLEAAANSLYEANEERMVRERCIARRLAERREKTLERDIQLLRESNSALEKSNSSLEKQVVTLEDRIKELESQLHNEN